MRPEEWLEHVRDRESFIAFVRALAEERTTAEGMERANPTAYGVDGALDWKNADIASFLSAALAYFADTPSRPPQEHPSWKMVAEFLYCGKIIE